MDSLPQKPLHRSIKGTGRRTYYWDTTLVLSALMEKTTQGPAQIGQVLIDAFSWIGESTDRRPAGEKAEVRANGSEPVFPVDQDDPKLIDQYGLLNFRFAKRFGKTTHESFELAFYDHVQNKIDRQRQLFLPPSATKVSKAEAFWLLARIIAAGWWETVTDCFYALRQRVP